MYLTVNEAGQFLIWSYVAAPDDIDRPGQDVHISIPIPCGHRTGSLEVYGSPSDEENEPLLMFGVKRHPQMKPRMTVLIGSDLVAFQKALAAAIGEANTYLASTGLSTVAWGEENK